MNRDNLPHLLRSLRTLAGPAGAGLDDEQLLERFAEKRDEAAFELLLWRHGPTVLGVCRRLLSDPHDAEDAFQAAFLVLAKKAGAIVRRQAVGTWLYRVAYRVALRARAERARSRVEQADLDRLAGPAGPDPLGHELHQVLDEELNRLSARHREVFVLCCLEGKTGEEAARQLGCRPGTVSSRLCRARERLRRRLARRGLGPAVLPAALPDALAPPVPQGLVHPTLAAALLFTSNRQAGGELSARAVAYAQGVLRTMFLDRLRFAALFLLLAGFLAVGGLITRQALQASPGLAQDDGQARPGRTDDQEKAPDRPIVRVVRPRQGGVGRKVRQPGTLEAFDRADLYPAVSGVLTRLNVDIGSRVKQGQVLAEVGAPLLVLAEKQASVAVRQARGLVAEAEARLLTAKAEAQASKGVVTQRNAEVDGAKANLTFHEAQLARIKRLAANMAVAREMMEEKERQAAAAKAHLAAATAALGIAKADAEVKQGKVAVAEASLGTAKTNVEAAGIELEKARHALGQTKIVAPFDGVVTRRTAWPGHVLRGGEGAGRQLLLTLQRTDRLCLVSSVPERDAPLTEVGLPVELTIPSQPGLALAELRVSRTAFAIEPQTRTMRVEVDIPNPKQQLRPGMFATMTIVLQKGRPDALRLPLSCLVPARWPATRGTVYVVRGNRAHRTIIRIGASDGQELDVLSGLKATDRVVADPKGLSGEVVPVDVKEKGEGE